MDLPTIGSPDILQNLLDNLHAFAGDRGVESGPFQINRNRFSLVRRGEWPEITNPRSGSPQSAAVDRRWAAYPSERALALLSAGSAPRHQLFEINRPPFQRRFGRLKWGIWSLGSSLPIARRLVVPYWASLPGIEQLGQLILVGHGTRLKLFNFQSKEVHSIILPGVSREDFAGEIEAKHRAAEFLSVPESISENLDSPVPHFSEQLIEGPRMRNQVIESDVFASIVSEMVDGLAAMYERQGAKSVRTSEYLESLVDHLSVVEKIPGVALPHGSELAETLKGDLRRKGMMSTPIPLVMAHRDFNTKNILFDRRSGTSYLIDWEYWGEATAFHDLFHFATMEMAERGRPWMLESLLADLPRKADRNVLSKLAKGVSDSANKSMRVLMFRIYLLERERLFGERLLNAIKAGNDPFRVSRLRATLASLENTIVTSSQFLA